MTFQSDDRNTDVVGGAILDGNAPVFTIRASALPGYSDCPRRAAGRLFRKLVADAGFNLRPLPQTIGAVVGTAVHRAAEVIMKAKAATGLLPPEAEATEAALITLRERAAFGLVYDRETPTLGDAETQVVRMAAAYRRDIAPQVTPLMVEARLETEIGAGLVLSGQSDVIAREPGRIRDLKTGKSPSGARAQLGAYALLAKAHGLEITGVMIDFVRRVACRLPQPSVVSTTHDLAGCERAARAILRIVAADLDAFRRGDTVAGVAPGDPWAFPANPNSKLCSEKWCQAFGTMFCREHALQQTV